MKISATFIGITVPECHPVPAEFITVNNSVEVKLTDTEGNLHQIPSDWILPKYKWETLKQYKQRLRHYLYSLYENNMMVIWFCPPEEL